MIVVKGKYIDGRIELLQKINSKKPMKVIVTFLDEVETLPNEKLSSNKFNFSESRKILKNVKSNFSDTVYEERMLDL